MSILLAATLSGVLNMCDGQAWDDKFTKPLESIATADDAAAPAVAKQLTRVRDSFESNIDYSEARELARQIGAHIRSQVRVEIGGPGTTIYKVLWVLEAEDKLIMISNLKGSLAVRELARTQWNRVHESLVKTAAWNATSAADFAMLDGTVYFASICFEEGAGQFVVYAPVLGDTAGNQERAAFARQTQQQARVLQHLLSLAPEETRPAR